MTEKINNVMIWEDLNWGIIISRVRKLQYRIFDYSKTGNTEKVHHLQRILVGTPEAKLLAVLTVTQDNVGKRTPGVDGISQLTPRERVTLVKQLKIRGTSHGIRRVDIPKGPGKTRPLGIPTMKDRATQALAKLALEPQWECVFEENSYGFRPGRRCQDAIEAIHLGVNKKAKYVLDADITKCFDEIDHEKLLEKLNTFPQMKRQIRAWLKAGILKDGQWTYPEQGTPQGGVISPLLANIALHGMENYLKGKMEEIPIRTPKGDKTLPKRDRRNSLQVIRYADDFVIMHSDLSILETMRDHCITWLAWIGLRLNTEKTRMKHSRHALDTEKPGFNFLGFHIRNYEVGKNREGAKKQGFRTMIKPEKGKIKKHYREMKKIMKEQTTIQGLIYHLNPKIRGWCNYYSHVASKKEFARVDSLMLVGLMRWAKRKHSTRPKKWITDKYLKKVKNRQRFGYQFKDKWSWVITHAETPIKRYVKISGKASPYDNNSKYWKVGGRNTRREDAKTIKIVKRQGGKCRICKVQITPMDVIEIDHVQPKSEGGSSRMNNLQAIHKHCHDAKTRKERKERKKE